MNKQEAINEVQDILDYLERDYPAHAIAGISHLKEKIKTEGIEGWGIHLPTNEEQEQRRGVW